MEQRFAPEKLSGKPYKALYGLSAWDESPYYTDRERAALKWCEAVTHLHNGFVSDRVYEEVAEELTEQEISDLTFVVVAINAWNRLSVAGRKHAGDYQPGMYS